MCPQQTLRSSTTSSSLSAASSRSVLLKKSPLGKRCIAKFPPTMDIASLIIGLPPLVAGFWKLAQSLNDFRRRFESVPMTLRTLEVQCGTLSTALAFLGSENFAMAVKESPQEEQTIQVVRLLITWCQDELDQIKALVEDFSEKGSSAW